jgi:hypothetical protein
MIRDLVWMIGTTLFLYVVTMALLLLFVNASGG